MASLDAYLKLDDLEQNTRKTVILGGKKYKIKAMCNYVAEKRDRYTAKAQLSFNEDGSKVITHMATNRKLVPKCLSLMLLGSFFKVFLFHWFYWRYLNVKYSQEEMVPILQSCEEMNNIGFFLSNLASLQASTRMIEKMTRTDSTNIIQELRSVAATQSSSNSTDI